MPGGSSSADRSLMPALASDALLGSAEFLLKLATFLRQHPQSLDGIFASPETTFDGGFWSQPPVQRLVRNDQRLVQTLVAEFSGEFWGGMWRKSSMPSWLTEDTAQTLVQANFEFYIADLLPQDMKKKDSGALFIAAGRQYSKFSSELEQSSEPSLVKLTSLSLIKDKVPRERDVRDLKKATEAVVSQILSHWPSRSPAVVKEIVSSYLSSSSGQRRPSPWSLLTTYSPSFSSPSSFWSFSFTALQAILRAGNSVFRRGEYASFELASCEGGGHWRSLCVGEAERNPHEFLEVVGLICNGDNLVGRDNFASLSYDARTTMEELLKQVKRMQKKGKLGPYVDHHVDRGLQAFQEYDGF